MTQLIIDGRRPPKSRAYRYLVVVDGREVYLMGRSYEYISKLAAAHNEGDGWVSKIDLEPYEPNYASRGIYLIKRELEVDIIDNDRRGSYRIRPDVDVQFNEKVEPTTVSGEWTCPGQHYGFTKRKPEAQYKKAGREAEYMREWREANRAHRQAYMREYATEHRKSSTKQPQCSSQVGRISTDDTVHKLDLQSLSEGKLVSTLNKIFSHEIRCVG